MDTHEFPNLSLNSNPTRKNSNTFNASRLAGGKNLFLSLYSDSVCWMVYAVCEQEFVFIMCANNMSTLRRPYDFMTAVMFRNWANSYGANNGISAGILALVRLESPEIEKKEKVINHYHHHHHSLSPKIDACSSGVHVFKFFSFMFFNWLSGLRLTTENADAIKSGCLSPYRDKSFF